MKGKYEGTVMARLIRCLVWSLTTIPLLVLTLQWLNADPPTVCHFSYTKDEWCLSPYAGPCNVYRREICPFQIEQEVAFGKYSCYPTQQTVMCVPDQASVPCYKTYQCVWRDGSCTAGLVIDVKVAPTYKNVICD